MIDIKLSPHRIPVRKVAELIITITNRSSGDITHLIANVDIPVSLLVIKGSRKVSVPRLLPRRVVQYKYLVRCRKIGSMALRIRGLSFRGPDGKIQRYEELQLPLEVSEEVTAGQADPIALQITISASDLYAGQWGRVTGVVRNVGRRMVENLRVVLEAPWRCEPCALPPLPAGGEVGFSMPALSSQAGDQVPAMAKVISPSGSVLASKKAFFQVSLARAAKGQGNLIIEGSTVEITQGDRLDTRVSVSGDAVITGSEIGGRAAGGGLPKCARCGKEVDTDAKFCAHCGARLGSG